jgi:hypothetical protein
VPKKTNASWVSSDVIWCCMHSPSRIDQRNDARTSRAMSAQNMSRGTDSNAVCRVGEGAIGTPSLDLPTGDVKAGSYRQVLMAAVRRNGAHMRPSEGDLAVLASGKS